MSAPVNRGQGGGDAAPIPFDIPTDPADADATLWGLVRAYMALARHRQDLSRQADALAEDGFLDRSLKIEDESSKLFDQIGSIEQRIFATPVRTARGFMVKLELAVYWAYGSDRNWGEAALPPLSVEGGYFAADPCDGGDGFDRRAVTAAWQDAVRLFGLPPLLDPEWRAEP